MSSSKRPFARFLLVFSLILTLATLYLGFSLSSGSSIPALVWLPIVGTSLLIWALPTFVWRSAGAGEGRRDRALLQRCAYVAMVFQSWLFVLTLARDLGLGVTRAIASEQTTTDLVRRFPGGFVLAGALGLTLVGYWIAMRGPRVRRVQVRLARLPKALEGTRIAQITDLHVGPTIRKRYVERVVRLVDKLAPDFTVLTGDIVDGTLASLRESVSPLAHLAPKGRVYYSPGNHEYYWRLDEWLPELTRLGAVPLLNRGELVEHRGHRLWIGGVTDPAAVLARGEPPQPEKAAEGSRDADFKILLSHRPEMARRAAKAGFDLQISGHTHGGQFFPWTFVASFFHEFFLGLMNVDGLAIYVSPGTGTWGPPARLGTIPEVTLLELTAA